MRATVLFLAALPAARALALIPVTPGVERIVYPDFRHEIFNELGWQQVLDDLLAWLDEHLPG